MLFVEEKIRKNVGEVLPMAGKLERAPCFEHPPKDADKSKTVKQGGI